MDSNDCFSKNIADVFPPLHSEHLKENLDLNSGMKYVYLLTENSLAKVGVLWELFR